MAFQSAPDCANAIIHATYLGKPIANVLSFRKAGGYSEVDLQFLAETVAYQVNEYYKPYCNASVLFVSVQAKGLELPVDYSYASLDVVGAGTASGSAGPANVSLCVTMRTGHTGRSARGRFYAFPASMGALSGPNTFLTAYGTALETFLQHVREESLLVGWEQVILSRYSLGAARPVAIGYPVNIAFVRNLTVDSQRNRLPSPH